MKIRLSFHKIDAIRESAGGFICEESSLSLLAPKVVDDETHECARIADVNAAIAAYVAKCEASGFCGRVFAHDRSPRGVRAINGFKGLPAANRGILVNKAVGWAEGAL